MRNRLRNTRPTSIIASAALFLVSATMSQATIYTVAPGDDIQAAIDLAITGDTIQFAAGTYTVTSELVVLNKGITLQGMGKALGTIIQRDSVSMVNHRVLRIEGTPGTPSVPYDPDLATLVSGFTFKNGNAGVNSGGNILVKESPYSIVENSIIENGTATQGGGISMEVGGTLRNSIVRSNTTLNSSQNQGGGIYARYGGNLIENSIIYNNWADVGGGVGLKSGGADNDPSLSGLDARTRIVNSTIANNSVDGIPAYGIYGGGVGSQLHGYESFVTDSIVTFNLGGANPNDIQNITIASAGTLTVTYSDNGAAAYPGTGNINANPLFVGTGEAWEYYRLQVGSPAEAASSTSGPMGAVLDQSTFQVPEPSSTVLIGLAGGLCLARRKPRQISRPV